MGGMVETSSRNPTLNARLRRHSVNLAGSRVTKEVLPRPLEFSEVRIQDLL